MKKERIAGKEEASQPERWRCPRACPRGLETICHLAGFVDDRCIREGENRIGSLDECAYALRDERGGDKIVVRRPLEQLPRECAKTKLWFGDAPRFA